MVSRPKLSIIIISFNDSDYLNRCLLSIQTHPPACSYEVIVIDNGSWGSSVKHVAESFSEVHLFRNDENLGFAAANNQGIRKSTGSTLFFLNSDTKLLPGAFQILLRILEEHPEVGIVGPTELHPSGRAYPSISPLPSLLNIFLTHTNLRHRFYRYRWFHPYRRKWEAALADNTPIPVDRVSGATLMVRRRVLDVIGFFDETFFFYMEETDLCKRAHDNGWEIYFVPRARIIHLGGTATKKVGNGILSLAGILGELNYFKKHKSTLELIGLRVLLFFEYACKYLCVGRKDPRQWAFRETLYAVLSLRPWVILPKDRQRTKVCRKLLNTEGSVCTNSENVIRNIV